MSEQANNSQGSETQTTQEIESGLMKIFGGDEPPAASSKPRNESGQFVRTGPNEQEQEAAEGEPQETEQQGQEPAQQQSEEAEVEIDGERYVVPVKIKDRFIHHADYTRKTQDLAELRRVTSAEREASNLSQAFDQSVAPERNQLAIISAQLEHYAKVDWGQMETEQLLRTRAQFDQLKDAKSRVEEAIKAKRGDFDKKIDGLKQEAVNAGKKYISQHIKGYDEKVQRAIHEYGVSEGYTSHEMSSIMDPRLIVSIWKASQWDQLKASQPDITKRAQQAAPGIRPGARQPTVSRVSQLSKNIQQAKPGKAKAAATEDYFAYRLGGGR